MKIAILVIMGLIGIAIYMNSLYTSCDKSLQEYINKNKDLTTQNASCKTSLTACNTDKTICNTSLSTCNTDKNTCNNDKSSCNTNGMLLFMQGPWVNITQIKNIARNPDGTTIYMIEEQGQGDAIGKTFTKMVSDTGQAKYYIDKMSKFDSSKWSTYSDAGTNYRLRVCPMKCTKGCNEIGACI